MRLLAQWRLIFNGAASAVRRSLTLFLARFLVSSLLFAVVLSLIGISILLATLIAAVLSITTTNLAYRRMELNIIKKLMQRL